MLNLCPHHGYESWQIVSFFYDGLIYRELQFVEIMCNGSFLQKSLDEAFEFLEELVESLIHGVAQALLKQPLELNLPRYTNLGRRIV